MIQKSRDSLRPFFSIPIKAVSVIRRIERMTYIYRFRVRDSMRVLEKNTVEANRTAKETIKDLSWSQARVPNPIVFLNSYRSGPSLKRKTRPVPVRKQTRGYIYGSRFGAILLKKTWPVQMITENIDPKRKAWLVRLVYGINEKVFPISIPLREKEKDVKKKAENNSPVMNKRFFASVSSKSFLTGIWLFLTRICQPLRKIHRKSTLIKTT